MFSAVCICQSSCSRGVGDHCTGHWPQSLGMFKLVHYETQTAGKWAVGIQLNTFLLPSAMQLRQGYVFTGICDSVHRGGVADTYWADTSPGRHTPLARHPPAQCMLRYTPLPSACWDTHPPAQCMLGCPLPTPAATAVDVMHPTGMRSCCILNLYNAERLSIHYTKSFL